MKSILLAVVTLIVPSSLGLAQTPASTTAVGSDEQAICQIEDEVIAAQRLACLHPGDLKY